MESVLSFVAHGFLHAKWWEVLLFAAVATHFTIISVTVFLHRSQTHRGLDLHPAVMHVFRFWLWMTTGMVTKEWVAIHRKHHAKCEREGDPHSPMIYGIARVFLRGAELYREEATKPETLSRYGHGTPDDWLERKLYTPHSLIGIILMMIIDVSLFGAIGLTVWAVQMAWIPFWAAGVVNGIGHYWGYRNYSSPDTSTNVFPWGLVIGGEELHNNHHAHATSAKFSSKWYEFDLGWCYIVVFKALGLAKVRKVAPKLKLESQNKPIIDLHTLQGVITHRYEVMARYAKLVKQAARQELAQLKANGVDGGVRWASLNRVRRWLPRSEAQLQPDQVEQVADAIAENKALSTLVQMRSELGRIWESSSASSEQLLHDLQAWCQRAQHSGIESLEKFALRLRRYAA